MATPRFLIALGSNVPHPRHGAPPAVLRAALAALEAQGLVLVAASAPLASDPVGPSQRRYANAAAVVETGLAPPALLALLQRIEHQFGRRRRGRRWRARTLDLDIVLWTGGCWHDRALTVPHPLYRTRGFVLGPALAVAADWRDPLGGLSVRQLHARLPPARRCPIRRLTRTAPPPR